ncbi:NYN domain-containing protein [Albidovulum sediminicola]|uniref:NYN domain-containing protein n=1 Tax=Albidovulum sediminicola TaxID=2984331 RepID=A0ABT2Z382_9RHOB|nr:NYN domain-containing protein [Defluviimonas sp. WL0075]MCV2865605.1 NYN domain-containing protein [Defluviimonas sp. WL0075]
MNAACNSDWHGAAGFRLIHAGTGKNAADLLLCIDAMELAMGQSFSDVVIASSDGDFAHLAVQLRERGLRVIGVGEAKAPPLFRAACTRFEVVSGKAPERTWRAYLAARPSLYELDPRGPEAKVRFLPAGFA